MADTTSTTSMPVGTTGAGGGNMLRITGLNTGLDVDAMVKKMLTADQTKIDQAKQQQQLIQWKQEAYQSIVKDVKDLQSAYFDVTNSNNYLLTSNNYNNMSASSGDSTVTATAAAGIAVGTYKIQVSEIAKTAAISGNSVNSQYAISDGDVSNWKGNISFTVDGGTAVNVDLSGFSGSNVQDLNTYINKQINAAGLNGKVSTSVVMDSSGQSYLKFTPSVSDTVEMSSSNISYIGSTPKPLVSVSSSTKLTDLGINAGINLGENIVLNLNYNGKEISVGLDNSSTGKNGSATVGDLITAIQNATGGAVTGKFDDMTGKFTLQTTATGSTASLQIEDNMINPTTDNPSHGATTSDLLTALGISNTVTDNLYAAGQGSDAVVTITEPGSSTGTTLTESSNNFTVNGVSYSITGETANPVSISVSTDTSKMHDLISNFLDKYNTLVGEIQDQLNEKRDYDYLPLTDTQKSSMSDTDITNWENKAKQGVLANDDNLENLLNSLRQAFTSPVKDSSGNNVSTLAFGDIGSNAIGIDTSNDYTQGGKMTIVDDQKFTDALTNHADEVMKLFTNSFSSVVNTQYTVNDASSWKGGKISFTLDGSTTVNVDLTDFNGTSTSELAEYINSLLTSSDLSGKLSVSGTDNTIKFTSTAGDSTIKMSSSGISDLSSTSVGLTADSTTAFNNSGIFQRINNILQQNVGVAGTSLNSAILTKYANLQDDYSLYGGGTQNTLPDQIYQQQQLITNLTSKMNDDQTKYYNQFTQLETAMEQLSAQQAAISSYFSS